MAKYKTSVKLIIFMKAEKYIRNFYENKKKYIKVMIAQDINNKLPKTISIKEI
jgi:hypothetical protein